MELLAALARHKHFARAAEASGISQPAFSARIRNLEQELGIAIVNRGNRFQDFTREGELVLKWAHRLLQDADGLRQDIGAALGNLTGRLVLGTIPTTLAFAVRVSTALRAQHPDLLVEITSATSDDIHRGLRGFSLDAGLSYLGAPTDTALRSFALYDEDYLLVAPLSLAPAGPTITWCDAAKLPLCLLSRDMQNRRILDETFAGLGVTANTVVETNSFTAALLQLESGQVATIIPRQLSSALPDGKFSLLDLVEPTLRRPVGLLLPDRIPAPPAHAALHRAVAGLLQ